jgi:hypothetical protein
MIKGKKVFECEYCNKKYKIETHFMKHSCTPMKRAQEFKTPMGQAAWAFYKEWMLQQKRRMPDSRAFLASTQYGSFIRFAEMVRKTRLPKPAEFIKLMIKRGYFPSMWKSPQIYDEYMTHMDMNMTYAKHIEITKATLHNQATHFQCEIGDVFEHLSIGEVITLIRERKLSAWILILSDKFKNYFKENATQEQLIVMTPLLNIDHWVRRTKSNENSKQEILKFISESKL